MTALVPHVASRAPVGYTRGPFGATGRKRTFALRDDDGQYRQMGDLKKRLLGGACAATLKAKGSVAAAIADQATRMACDTPSFAGLGNEAARTQGQGLAQVAHQAARSRHACLSVSVRHRCHSGLILCCFRENLVQVQADTANLGRSVGMSDGAYAEFADDHLLRSETKGRDSFLKIVTRGEERMGKVLKAFFSGELTMGKDTTGP